MPIEMEINGSTAPRSAYVTWASSACAITQTENEELTVTLRNEPEPGGGRVRFRASAADDYADELTVTLPAGGRVAFQIAGRFGSPSTRDRDTAIVVVDDAGNERHRKPLMVRIRKNANHLTEDERDRFLSAMVRLNTVGVGGLIPFLDVQNMHTAQADPEIHQRPSFLPWHRAYVLDLERRLQAIDASVTLPYWRFDQPNPFVFDRDFMGVPTDSGELDFTATNPLINWVSRVAGSGNPRIRRYNFLVIFGPPGTDPQIRPFDPATARAVAVSNGQLDTVNLGADPVTGDHAFDRFRQMEGDPHGAAHVSFFGQISSAATAPADPLFFLLHCNVDRLWARWQWLHDGYGGPRAYELVGQGDRVPTVPRLGDFADDTMWPWNQDRQPPRPNTAPGGAFPPGVVSAPRPTPTVGEMLDFQGELDPASDLGFGYDDVEIDHGGQP